MKGSKREKSLAGLALFLALVAVFSLGGLALAVTYGGTAIVSTERESRSFSATQTNLVWDPRAAIDPTEIYEKASEQTVIVEAPVPDMNDAIHAYGAGFLISYDGYIMTNCHVVSEPMENGAEVQIRTFAGKVYPAEIVGADQDSDIALLKIKEYVTPAVLGDSSKLKPCQSVYIMGHPADELSFTMTSGIISALGRTITFSDGTTLNMFQLDAAVNFGNSGGPVYNDRGEVIGITTAKYTGLSSEGLGFAIPINDAVRIAEDLRNHGFVRGRPLMGLTVRAILEDEREGGNPAGVEIYSVSPGLCGERAGLQAGDIILSLNGQRVTSNNELMDAKRPFRAGDTVTLEIWRDGETFTTELTFDEVTPDHPTGSVTIPEEESEEPEDGEETEESEGTEESEEAEESEGTEKPEDTEGEEQPEGSGGAEEQPAETEESEETGESGD
ncbi:MAG: trypsin-like peptidase domain-containing protein [Oscillospiraceae bacterium]|nr:trypsin-like peptidase domain-containing protein [Oscillospiraceae bacterium]